MVDLYIGNSISEVPILKLKTTLIDELFFVCQVKLSDTEYKFILIVFPEMSKGKNLNQQMLIKYLKHIFEGFGPENLLTAVNFSSQGEFFTKVNKQKYQMIYVVNKDESIMPFLENVVEQLFVGGFQIEKNELWISVSSQRFEDNYHLCLFLNQSNITCKTCLYSLPILEITNMPYALPNPSDILHNILDTVFPKEAPNFYKIVINDDKWLVLFNSPNEVDEIIPKIDGGQLGENFIEAKNFSSESIPEPKPKSKPKPKKV